MEAHWEADTPARVVLVHDWLTGMRGGEKCLEVAARHWPGAPLFTLLHRPGSVAPSIETRPLRTSFLQHFPRAHTLYRYFLPLMPTAVRSWRLPPADLVLSFSHCVAKSVRPALGPDGPAPHVCYCFTPMRYAWQMRQAYFGGRLGSLPGRMVDALLDALRDWDRETASGVDHFIAISRTIQARIRECYGRDSVVIYPPADTDFYTPAPVQRKDYYLVVSAFAPYKRLDLAVEACARLGRPLVVIGSGQDAQRVQSQARGEVRFLGWQSDEVIRDHLRRCQALLFPGEEDFGIVPVEAMACGTPVIAYGQGGCTETVVPLEKSSKAATGLWFEEQRVECLIDALERFEAQREAISPQACRRQAERFSLDVYRRQLLSYIGQVHRGVSPAQSRAA
ncbi:MAG: glycosyltransferase [Gemmataceae bacterium]